MMITRRSIFVVAFLVMQFFFCIDPGCKNPDDFNPPEDTLIYAPQAPVIIQPADSFVFMDSALPVDARMAWETVAGAEIYEVEIAFKNNNPNILISTRSYYDIAAADTFKFGAYSWRVRGSSPAWKGGYTDWTSRRVFGLRYRLDPPFLVHPDDNDTLVFDSLPAPVLFQWDTVPDAQYYEIDIRKDSLPFFSEIVYGAEFEFYFETTGLYEWRVRAGSVRWELKTAWSTARNLSIW